MTTKANRWLLPDGVDELLPPHANQLEQLRREILDLYSGWGYDLIKTPLIEFLDSLLIVPSAELQLSTFKLVDQLSGKSMGVRADISSQAARIDAHVLQREGVARLCYADSVLRTRPQGPLGSRCPQLIGAELYGHSGLESDLEVISLMLLTLQISGLPPVLLALGHNQICRRLLSAAKLPPETGEKLFTALQNKATTDINQLLSEIAIAAPLKGVFAALPALHGDIGVLVKARTLFAGLDAPLKAELGEALSQLERLAGLVSQSFPEQALYFDLCEQRGYDYHTGLIFSAYTSGHGEAIANGGRYDAIGEVFGRARAATGFDADLKTLLLLSKRTFTEAEKIYAPDHQDPALTRMVSALRKDGRCVVQGFDTSTGTARSLGCTSILILQNNTWQISSLN